MTKHYWKETVHRLYSTPAPGNALHLLQFLTIMENISMNMPFFVECKQHFLLPDKIILHS